MANDMAPKRQPVMFFSVNGVVFFGIQNMAPPVYAVEVEFGNISRADRRGRQFEPRFFNEFNRFLKF